MSAEGSPHCSLFIGAACLECWSAQGFEQRVLPFYSVSPDGEHAERVFKELLSRELSLCPPHAEIRLTVQINQVPDAAVQALSVQWLWERSQSRSGE